MPRIRTYEQQTSSPNVTVQPGDAGQGGQAIGQGLEKLGGSLMSVSDAIEKAETQQDISAINRSLSDIRARSAMSIQEGVRSGGVNVQGIHDGLQEEFNTLLGNIRTARGRQYFDEHSESLKSGVLSDAITSQAVLTGKLVVENLAVSFNNNANTLQASPGNFQSILTESINGIEEMVQSGALDRLEAEKQKRIVASRYAESTIIGTAKISADAAEKELNSGKYDMYLDGDSKKGLQSTINAYKSAEETDRNRSEKLLKDAEKKRSEAWENDNLGRIYDKSISAKEILESPMTADTKKEWMRMLNHEIKESTKTDPAVYADVTRRILLPKEDPQAISSLRELYGFVGKGLMPKDLSGLSRLLDNTEDGSRYKSNRKSLFDQADVMLMKRNPLTGVPDPQGPYAKSLFINALRDREEEFRKAGKDISELYNPNSKDYFGHEIFRFVAPAKEQFERSMRFEGFKNPTVKETRQEGESAADYLKRTKGQ